MKYHTTWLKRGFKDFFLVVLLGMLLVLFCFTIISALVFIGMPPEYASTIISLCLLFAGSMMFSYFDLFKLIYINLQWHLRPQPIWSDETCWHSACTIDNMDEGNIAGLTAMSITFVINIMNVMNVKIYVGNVKLN